MKGKVDYIAGGAALNTARVTQVITVPCMRGDGSKWSVS